jgi:uncharacterized protein (TIRG00374 family)
MTAVDVLLPPATEFRAERSGVADRHAKRKVIIFLAVLAVLVVEMVLVAPYFDRAISAVDRPNVSWLSIAVVAELMSMSAFARVQRRMLSAGGTRVPMCRITALTYAANAVSVCLPGGTALSAGYAYRRLRSWGATVPAAGFTLVASGVLSTTSFASLALVCAVLVGGAALSSLLVVAGLCVAIVLALLVRPRLEPGLPVRVVGRGLKLVNRITHRAPETGFAGLRRIVGEISEVKPRYRDWLAGFGFAGMNWVADLACLVASCQAVGGSGSSLVFVMAAYVAGMGTATISPLPGGLGVADAAMIVVLTRGGASTVSATAAVLLYRLVSVALVCALGWLIWATTWLADRRGATALPVSRNPRTPASSRP